MALGRDGSHDCYLEDLVPSHSPAPNLKSNVSADHTVKLRLAGTRRPRTWVYYLCTGWTWLSTDSWILEWASLTLAIAALVTIGIVLLVYRQRNPADWKYSISLNTVLTVLATVMKGAMMLLVGSCLGQLKWAWYCREKRVLRNFRVFDEASRGPYGATKLLYVLRFCHIASIGCVVTLMDVRKTP